MKLTEVVTDPSHLAHIVLFRQLFTSRYGIRFGRHDEVIGMQAADDVRPP